jgi:hypothetical protein
MEAEAGELMRRANGMGRPRALPAGEPSHALTHGPSFPYRCGKGGTGRREKANA